MIHGYIILLQSGIFISAKFFGRFEGVENTDVSLVASGLAALTSFFDKVAGNPLENVILGDYKLSIRREGEIIIAIFADRNDAIAEGLAKKYAKMLSECSRDICQNLGEFEDDRTKKELERVTNKLEEEIKVINDKARDMRYLPNR